MATETLTLYKNNTQTQAFGLAQTSATKTVWLAAGRAISLPYSVSVERKPTSANSASNDHVVLRVSRVEANASTGKLASLPITLDISIPKDQSVLTLAVQKEMLCVLASALNEATAMEATNANITKLIEGRDL